MPVYWCDCDWFLTPHALSPPLHTGMLMFKLSEALFDMHQPDVDAVKIWLLQVRKMSSAELSAFFVDNPRWWRTHKSIRKSIPQQKQLEQRLDNVMLWAQHSADASEFKEPLPVAELMQVHENQIKLVRSGLISGELQFVLPV